MHDNKFQQRSKSNHRVNNQIRIPQVMVVDDEGRNLGIMTSDKARWLARDKDLDLVEVAPTAKPPVCRIMDYNKFKYDQSIKEKEKKNNTQKVQLKELRIRPVTGEHDLFVKVRNAERWIKEGDKVLLRVKFKKREYEHKDLGLGMINKIVAALESVAQVQSPAKFAGDSYTCVIEPKKERLVSQNVS